MGYETKLYVCTKYTFPPRGSEPTTCGVIAMIDLCKVGHGPVGDFLGRCRESRGERYAFYAEDGNTLITEDMYATALTEVPLLGLIMAMEEEWRDGGYRRFDVALRLLSGFADPAWEHDDLVLLQFGH